MDGGRRLIGRLPLIALSAVVSLYVLATVWGLLFALVLGERPWGDGPLGFVPDQYMGEEPEAVKTALKSAYGSLLERKFDHLLLAHGDPWIGGGKAALREFVES